MTSSPSIWPLENDQKHQKINFNSQIARGILHKDLDFDHSRWTNKSFLALVNILVYELLFIFGDTVLDKVPPGSLRLISLSMVGEPDITLPR